MSKIALRISLFFILLAAPLMTACTYSGKKGECQKMTLATSRSSSNRGTGHLVVIDPGHGGFDIGAKSQNIEEKEIALQTATLLKRHLSSRGYRVILTRSRDVFIPLKKRAAIANETKSHLLVSIHYNAFKNASVKGIEIYYYNKGSKWRSTNSKKLAKLVLSELLSHTKAASRGVKHGNFQVVREVNMPAILIEGGFITHPKERDQLSNESYLDQISRAIANGIDRYFH